MSIKKTINNLLTALAFALALTGANTSNAMEQRVAEMHVVKKSAVKKRKARCASEQSQGDDAVLGQTYKPLESKQLEKKKHKLQEPKAAFFEPDELEYEQPEDGQQDPMDSVYINNPSMAAQMEFADLFANNGAILNQEFADIYALMQEEQAAKLAASRAQDLAYAQAHPEALAQKIAYQQFLARQAQASIQKQVRAMQPQAFVCENCTYINEARLLACALCGQAR